MNLVLRAKELNRKLFDSGLSKQTIVVDTRPLDEYLNGHIPGAINIDLMQFHWMDTSRIGIRQFNRQMNILCSNLGLSDAKLCVFYDNISGPSASRGVWLSHYFSQFNASILDGGLGGWKEEGLEIEKETNAFSHSKQASSANSKVLADLKMVKSSTTQRQDNKPVLLDCRSEQEFDGRVVRALRKGHIPGAINIDWSHNIDRENSGKFKNFKDLAKTYSKISKNDEVITYCQGGYRAANTFIVLKMLGFEKVRMYLGSWGEWGNKPNLPVETGEK
jgi:thiosulfate/3-mercaptopyruvate sulfurtransferase